MFGTNIISLKLHHLHIFKYVKSMTLTWHKHISKVAETLQIFKLVF